jgi:hypothetical protein
MNMVEALRQISVSLTDINLKLFEKQLREHQNGSMKPTSHRSYPGHTRVYRLFTALDMRFECNETTFLGLDPQEFKPDLIFSREVDGKRIYLVLEVSARRQGGNTQKLIRQCNRAIRLLGENNSCSVGFYQSHTENLLVLYSCGHRHKEIVDLIRNKGSQFGVDVGSELHWAL